MSTTAGSTLTAAAQQNYLQLLQQIQQMQQQGGWVGGVRGEWVWDVREWVGEQHTDGHNRTTSQSCSRCNNLMLGLGGGHWRGVVWCMGLVHMVKCMGGGGGVLPINC